MFIFLFSHSGSKYLTYLHAIIRAIALLLVLAERSSNFKATTTELARKPQVQSFSFKLLDLIRKGD